MESAPVPAERGGRGRPIDLANGPLGWFLLFALAAAVFGLDQLTKKLVVQNLAPMGPGYHLPIIGDWLRLGYATNTGAAFGLFADRTVLLTILAIVALPLLVLGQSYLPVGGWVARVCAGLLLGGTLGNLTDRLRLGYVVDFVEAGVGNLRWPSFNVADSAFVIGILLMLLYVFLRPAPPRDPKHDQGGTAG